jgi:hypothetical protein
LPRWLLCAALRLASVGSPSGVAPAHPRSRRKRAFGRCAHAPQNRRLISQRTKAAPRVGRNCRTTGEYTSTLEFKLLKTSEVAQPLGDGSGVGSSTFGVLPGNQPSAQTPPTAPPPRIEQPKSEAGKPNDTKTAAAPLPQPSQGSMHPTATQGFMNKSLAPVIIALNVALPLLSILFLVIMLKSTARGY